MCNNHIEVLLFYLFEKQFEKQKEHFFHINDEERLIFLKLGDKKIKYQCHIDDEFDWEIGLGLAISKLVNSKKQREHRELFRNEKRKLNYREYAEWVLLDFYHCDLVKLNELRERVKKAKSKEKITL